MNTDLEKPQHENDNSEEEIKNKLKDAVNNMTLNQFSGDEHKELPLTDENGILTRWAALDREAKANEKNPLIPTIEKEIQDCCLQIDQGEIKERIEHETNNLKIEDIFSTEETKRGLEENNIQNEVNAAMEQTNVGSFLERLQKENRPILSRLKAINKKTPALNRLEAINKEFLSKQQIKPITLERERIKKENEEKKKMAPIPILMEEREPARIKTSLEQIDESIECPSVQVPNGKFVDNMPMAQKSKKPLKSLREKVLNVCLKHKNVKYFPNSDMFLLPHNAEYSIQVNNISPFQKVKFTVFVDGKDIFYDSPSYLDRNIIGELNNLAKMEIVKYHLDTNLKFTNLEQEIIIRYWKQFIPEKIDLNPLDSFDTNEDEDYPNRCFPNVKYEENYTDLVFSIRPTDPIKAAFSTVPRFDDVDEIDADEIVDKSIDFSELKINHDASVQSAPEEREEMAYKNGFVLAIKINGQILREIKKDVFLAPNSEYSILLKNTNSRDARFKLVILDKSYTQYDPLIKANSEEELFRFPSGEKFKVKGNSRISVKFQLEKDKVKIENEKYKHECYIDDLEDLVKEDGISGFLKKKFKYLKDPNSHCFSHEEQPERKFEDTETELFLNVCENKNEILVKDTKKKFCVNCGAKLDFNSKFCSNCGTKCLYGPLFEKEIKPMSVTENHESIDLTNELIRNHKKSIKPLFKEEGESI